MASFLEQLIPGGYVLWQIAIEFAVIWICVYLVLRFLRGTRGAGVIKGFALVLVIGTLLIRLLGQSTDAFTRLSFIYDRFLGLIAILLIVVFQPELRQAMSRLGHAWSFRAHRERVDTLIDAISEAVAFLSKSQFGALIAIERNTQLGELVQSGAPLDAKVSARLLESIFWPNSPLHDLGVVIRDDRIVAASVQFPLIEEGELPIEYGSRHRAAAGLSLSSDCLVIIVSEETGNVSIAERGKIDGIPRERFKRALADRLSAPAPAPPEPEPAKDKSETRSDQDPDEKQAA